MTLYFPRRALVSVCLGFVALTAARAHAQLAVSALSPAANANNVAANTTIAIDFDRALAPATLPPATNNVSVFGAVSGPVAGAWSLENANTRLRFTPANRFAAGEVVQIRLDHDLQAADATFLRAAGHAARFRVRTKPASLDWTQIADVSLRDTQSVSVRIYGGNATDLDRDGFADLPLACEDACDVRVLLNSADCSGMPQPLLTPTNPVQCTPSPNEQGDLNGDGLTDLVTCNGGGSVSVLLGNGDGSFQPAANYGVGSFPPGLALLDVDGDGDADIVTANNGTDNLALLLNNGAGVFGAATFFDSTGLGEYALTAADMTSDGIDDLVVGARAQSRVIVMRGNGNGTFTAISNTLAGGAVWMIVCGDVNGDGNMDVSCANSTSNNGSILFGNGAGGLTLGPVVAMGGHTPATDLGDLDGDGDLDWVLSSYGAGYWRFFKNDGAGAFTLSTQFPASSNPACSVLYDFDNDRDLDLVLLDEIADHATFFRNDDVLASALPFCFGDGSSGPCPCGNAGAAGHGCANSVNAAGAQLSATGSLTGDTVTLCATGMPASTFTLFLRWNTLEGVPQVFHDGLRCAGGALGRFGGQQAVAGSASFPGISLNTLSGVSATFPGSGATVFYGAFYRNASTTFCPPATANVTNQLQIVW
jgi:hypothetical protein